MRRALHQKRSHYSTGKSPPLPLNSPSSPNSTSAEALHHAVAGKKNSPKRLLSLSDFTLIYGPCRTYTYQLLNSGELAAVKVGRSTFIPADAAEEWAAGLPRYFRNAGEGDAHGER